MSRERLQFQQYQQSEHAALAVDVDAEHDPEVSRRASNAALRREAVQRKAAAAAQDQESVHEAAAHGTSSPGTALPHADKIQAAFGNHDISHIQAHVGGDAAEASRAMGAEAYASGNHVAFASEPDLHTAAHEAAHVVQQAHGVNLYGGVGEAGDAYERNADAVADRVVAGQSAEDLLGAPTASSGTTAAPQVQRKEAKQADPKEAHESSSISSFQAISASLLLFARQLKNATAEVRELVDGDHSTDAGEEPAAQRLNQIYDEVKNGADHMSMQIVMYGVDKSLRTHLAQDIAHVQSSYGYFHMWFHSKGNSMLKRNGYDQRDVSMIKRSIDELTWRIGLDPGASLGPPRDALEGDEKKLRGDAISAHIAGALSAIDSVEAGNAADKERVIQHVRELDALVDNKATLKANKSGVAKLKAALRALLKSHPDLQDTLQATLKKLDHLV